MTEDIQTQKEQNTVATVGMWFSISGLIAIILIVLGIVCLIKGFIIGIFLLFVGSILGLLTGGHLNLLIGFILGIIGLFYKPRRKARVAVIIPLIIFIAIASIASYIRSSVKTPAKEWYNWVKPNMEQLYNEENFDNDKFSEILQREFNKISSSLSEEEFKIRFENSTGSNSIEKGAYFGFGLFQQAIENSIEKYNNGELPEINEEDDNITDVDTEIEENDEEVEDESNEDKSNEEITIEQPKKTSNETFSQSEKNDIEQILNILE